MTAALAIGIDVGGSKIAACAFDPRTRSVVATRRGPTNAGRGGAAVLDDCVAAVNGVAAAAGADVAKTPVGIGICELVGERGAIASAATFDWRGVDVAARFASSTVVIESDVRAAACAEARLGAGAGHECFVYLTVGTGIAFSLVLDGRPHAGARGNALILGAPPVESVSSGGALAVAAGVATAEQAFERPELVSVIERAATELGRAMAWLVNALDPEVVVVGGGLGLRAEYREVAARAMRPAIEALDARDIPVLPAALGVDAGAIGAALLAADVGALAVP